MDGSRNFVCVRSAVLLLVVCAGSFSLAQSSSANEASVAPATTVSQPESSGASESSSTSVEETVHRRIVKQPAPPYPELARRMNLSGSVKLEVVIEPDGSVKSTKVLGGNPVLAASAEHAVKGWKYESGKGETTGTVVVRFKSVNE